MKRFLIHAFTSVALFLFVTLSVQAAEPSKANSQNYILDPTHSYVLWHINHSGFSNQSGKWMIDGDLLWDEAQPQNSKINATIKIADILTGVPKLDEHLKGEDFFNAAKFPTATFVSDKIKITGKTTAKIFGQLTLLGVSKPVVLNIKLNKQGINPYSQKKTLGFTGSTTIKRSEFGMSKYVPDVGDDVKIEIEAEANLAG